MSEYDISEIEKLADGKLPWTRVQEIMRLPKDTDRFFKWLRILQSRVPWPDRILLPLTTALFVVEKEDGRRIVKCRCGHEFDDYRVNWKLHALVYVRETEEQMREVYRGREMPDPNWVQIREYYCPGCGTQLEVEAVPRGCPPDFEFLPDIDSFYSQWLGQPLGGQPYQFEDRTQQVIEQWAREDLAG
ncbi:MAG: acetone carboxylase subunit gamma [Dehalococcoidia bacterium]|jgi:acetone carboxylase gamma subunit|nr:acetone carboxylase subunit gamma [Dehalococcoidia bacterium]MDW8009089.1 acetone carboxylase subunit gamma [Chloroflexota bacterium]